MNVMQRWRLRAERAAWMLEQPRTLRTALWLVPLMFGLFALKLGQDYNFDLRNYHLYNPFAFLNGKVGIDLAPAQMQTYFNPTIDLLYYGLVKTLPGPVAGFIIGTLQGLNFVLLTAIARAVLPTKNGIKPILLPLLLALAGMFGNGFISGVGNTTGDNLVALCVLAALVVLLRAWPQLVSGARMMPFAVAGICMGLGVGLKLTEAVFALGLCLGLLAMPVALIARARASFLFGTGVLVGLGITGGHWYWRMWSLYGNPLFPQFSSVFRSPLTAPISVADLRFLPRGIAEYLLWPIISVVHPLRVSEIAIANPIWALLFLGSIALLLKMLLRRNAAVPAPIAGIGFLDGRVRVLVAFVVTSYVIWMFLFGIYRYLTPIELLAPLMLWLLAQALLPRSVAGKVVVVLLLIVVASNFPRKNWGYTEWASNSFSAEVPLFSDPSQSLVIIPVHDSPMGWLVSLFPKEVAFATVDASFPESDAYRERIAAMAAARTGPLYAMFEQSGVQANTRMSATERSIALRDDAQRMARALAVVSRYGFSMDPASCVARPAYIGKRRFYYQLCRIASVSAASPG